MMMMKKEKNCRRYLRVCKKVIEMGKVEVTI